MWAHPKSCQQVQCFRRSLPDICRHAGTAGSEGPEWVRWAFPCGESISEKLSDYSKAPDPARCHRGCSSPRTWKPEIGSPWALASNLRDAIGPKPPHHASVGRELIGRGLRYKGRTPLGSDPETQGTAAVLRSVAAVLLAGFAFGFSAARADWLALCPKVSRLQIHLRQIDTGRTCQSRHRLIIPVAALGHQSAWSGCRQGRAPT